mmetsp:Transcript_15119/g.32475  ORF Transcript_15119/g.32475 Transcript_15119/m.32475 type:complete len:270 (+) Transcript_15119:934-1743(+)
MELLLSLDRVFWIPTFVLDCTDNVGDEESFFSRRNGLSSSVRSRLSISDRQQLSSSNGSPDDDPGGTKSLLSASDASDRDGEMGRNNCFCWRWEVEKIVDATEVVVSRSDEGSKDAVFDAGDTIADVAAVCCFSCCWDNCVFFLPSSSLLWNGQEFSIMSYGDEEVLDDSLGVAPLLSGVTITPVVGGSCSIGFEAVGGGEDATAAPIVVDDDDDVCCVGSDLDRLRTSPPSSLLVLVKDINDMSWLVLCPMLVAVAASCLLMLFFRCF